MLLKRSDEMVGKYIDDPSDASSSMYESCTPNLFIVAAQNLNALTRLREPHSGCAIDRSGDHQLVVCGEHDGA